MSINSLSSRIASYMAKELNYDRRREAQLVYGMELLFTTVLKVSCIMVLANFLGTFRETLLILVVSGSLRVVSGGEHCSAFHRCLIGGATVFLLISYFAKLISPVISYQELVIISVTSIGFIISILLKYAPGDTVNKPITEEEEKRRYRKLSLMVASVYLLAVFFLLFLRVFLDVAFLIIIGLLWQCFMITPFGYRFIRSVDSLLMFVPKGGRGHGTEDSDRR